MTDLSHTNNSMASSIRNPYRNSYRSSGIQTTMLRDSTASKTIETLVRNLLRNAESSADALPSIASMQALNEQLLLVRRNNENDVDGDRECWPTDLALEFGSMVENCCSRIRHGSVCVENDAPNSKAAAGAFVLELLAKAMDEWEDHAFYAVLVQENVNINTGCKNPDSGEHLLDLLKSLSVHNDKSERICQNASICLAKAWLCLERLEEFTSLDSGNHSGGYRGENKGIPWWIAEGTTTNLLGIQSLQSLDQIYCGSKPSDEFCLQQEISSVDQDQVKVSLLTILVILLRYQVMELSLSPVASDISASSSIGGCIIPKGKLSQLISKLIKEIQILNHSVLSPSSSEYTLPIAILSMSVLSLLQRSLASSGNDSLFQSLNQTIQSTGLVENLVQFVFFPSAEHGGIAAAPRWAAMTSSNRFRTGCLRSFGFRLFSCWSFCDNAAWKVLVANLEPKLDALIHSFWSTVLDSETSHPPRNGYSKLEEQLPRILWLYLYMRSHARIKLSSFLESILRDCKDITESFTSKEMAPRKLIQSLFGFLRISSGTSYSHRMMVARLLRILLSDRRILSSNDELSRTFWEAIDEAIVEDYLQVVLEHACTNDADQPLLLALVDTMEILLEHSNSCNCLVEKMDAHNLEALIYLIKPNNIRYDFVPGTEEDVADMDTETPPLHNLSRMDETSICIEHEETKKPRGLDHLIRLSVATSLAHLAYGSSVAPPNESIGLLVSRISTVVNDFLVEHHAMIEKGANAQNDGNGMTSMDQIKRFARFQYRISTPENEDFLSTTLLTSMMLRRQIVLKHVEVQNETQQKLQMTLKRERKAQEEKTRLMQQLLNQSILFQREMSRAKTNLTQDTRQLVSMHASERSMAEERSRRLRKQTEEATFELERVKTDLQNAREELQTTRSTIEELHSTTGSLKQQVQDEKAKAEEIVNKAEANRETIQSFEEKCDDLQTAIEEREDVISRVEDTNQNLQDNLEDLFADMCSLAQIYQHNENQEESQKLKSSKEMEALNQKLAQERRSNKEFTSKIVDIEEENEKLYRKLGKYKDRLEQERRGRREELDRRKEEEQKRKRNGPVSYLNSLHTSSSSSAFDNDRSRSTRSSKNLPSQYKRSVHEKESSLGKSRDRSAYEKENSSGNHRSGTSQRRAKY